MLRQLRQKVPAQILETVLIILFYAEDRDNSLRMVRSHANERIRIVSRMRFYCQPELYVKGVDMVGFIFPDDCPSRKNKTIGDNQRTGLQFLFKFLG